MKNFTEIKKTLSEQKPILLKRYKVNRLGIFGSYVRGDQHQDSDLDVLIDYEDAPSLITLIELEYYLSEIVGVPWVPRSDMLAQKLLHSVFFNYFVTPFGVGGAYGWGSAIP